jgi:hypothetical protein
MILPPSAVEEKPEIRTRPDKQRSAEATIGLQRAAPRKRPSDYLDYVGKRCAAGSRLPSLDENDVRGGWLKLPQDQPCRVCGLADRGCRVCPAGTYAACFHVVCEEQGEDELGDPVVSVWRPPGHCDRVLDNGGHYVVAGVYELNAQLAFAKPPLLVKHAEELRQGSGLSDKQIQACGFYSEARPDVVQQLLGWKQYHSELGPCLAIPYFDRNGKLTGYVRLKPDWPRLRDPDDEGEGVVKYEAKKGSTNRAYFPPQTWAVLDDPSVSLLIVEGEKKAAKAAQEGFPTIGLSGVWNWTKRRDRTADGKPIGDYELIDDLAGIVWRGRVVYIVFDSDRATNENVRLAEFKLARLLAELGAVVRFVQLPEKEDGGKTGLDDYLLKHTKKDLQQLLDQADELRREWHDEEGLSNGYTVERITSEIVTDRKGNRQRVGMVECQRVPEPPHKIEERLLEIGGGMPKRLGNVLIVDGDNGRPLALEKSNDLVGWAHKCLPKTGRNLVEWHERAEGFVKKAEFFSYLQLSDGIELVEGVEEFPHHPLLPKFFYLKAAPCGYGGQALAGLLAKFEPASPVDAELIKAAFLTSGWGGLPGSRPMFVVTTDAEGPALASAEDEGDESEDNGRGAGKTTLVKALAHIWGGRIRLSPSESFEAFMKRLLSPAALGRRVVLIDNLKAMRFSWADLEEAITSDVLSGHRLFKGEGRRPNTLLWFVTVNGASLSKDLAKRSVVIKVKPAAYGLTWEEELYRYIDDNREWIIGDILAELRSEPVASVTKASRWGGWELGVLSHCANPDECQKVILSRQGEVDGDDEERGLVRSVFMTVLQQHGHNPIADVVRFTPLDVAKIFNQAKNENMPTNQATGRLMLLQIREIERPEKRSNKGTIYIWRGQEAGKNRKPVPYKGSCVMV